MRTAVQVDKISKEMYERLLRDLELAKRPVLHAIKTTLDNTKYDPKVGYLTPAGKYVATELNVSSVKKMSRAIFVLEVMLRNVETGGVNTKREIYYMAKGELKQNKALKALEFDDQD